MAILPTSRHLGSTTNAPKIGPFAAWRTLRWPLPALLLWACCAALQHGLDAAGAAPAAAIGAAAALGALAAWTEPTPWRRLILAAGYPAAWAASGAAAGLPALVWLLPLAVLLLAYPLRAWRDAPLFPTPADALDGLPDIVPLPVGARVLDAGCGLGDGLRALRRAYPAASLCGVEWSAPLAWACAARCRSAEVRRGDLWADDWSGLDLVYAFQRPESMARVWAKANGELRPGAWLISLAFAVPGIAPHAVLRRDTAMPVWIYRIGAAQAGNSATDMNKARPPGRRRRTSRGA